MNNDAEKTCKSCRYFKRYYVKVRLRFTPLEYGECWVRKRRKAEVRLPEAVACKNWETKEETDQIRKELAAGAMQVVCERVDELIALLKE